MGLDRVLEHFRSAGAFRNRHGGTWSEGETLNMHDRRERQHGTQDNWKQWFRQSSLPALLVNASSGTVLETNASVKEAPGLSADALLRLGERITRAASAGENHFSYAFETRGAEARFRVQLVRLVSGADTCLLALLFPTGTADSASGYLHMASELIDALATAETFDEALAKLLYHAAAGSNWLHSEAWTAVDGKLELRKHRTTRGLEKLAAEREESANEQVDKLLVDASRSGIPQAVEGIGRLRAGELNGADEAAECGVRALYILPLHADGKVNALLVFFFAEQSRADRDVLDTLTAMAGVLGLFLARRRIEQSLRDRESLMQSLFRNLPCSVYRRVLHPNGSVTYPYVGGRLLPSLGIDTDAGFDSIKEALGRVQDEDRDMLVREIYRSAREHSPLTLEYRIVDDDGTTRWLRTWSVPTQSEDGTIGWDAFTMDVTSEVRLRHSAQEQLHRDAVTNLPTRQVFERELAHMGAGVRRRDEMMAVLVFNVDRFRWINDAHGMAAGDAVLAAVARRLEETLPVQSAVARLGSDEFTVALGGLKSELELRRQLSVLNRVMQKSFRIFDQDMRISFTTGLCVLPADCDSPEELLRCASIAMHRGRRENKGKLTRFDPELDRLSRAVMTTETELRRALRERQFEVHYQPQVSMDLERLTGFEALVRWHHPERGLVPPGEFIPIAEESGLIEEVFPYVLDCVCMQYAKWCKSGLDAPPVSVNISPVQIHPNNHITAVVMRTLDEHDVPPACLKLEITEGTLLRNFGAGAALLAELADKGVSVVLDDFGVGYSSLGYLAQLPVRSLKIDRSFVTGLEQNVNAAKVLRAVITLAKSLDLEVTVEGIETQRQLDAIRQWGCRDMQGYFFSRPLPAEGATALMKKMAR